MTHNAIELPLLVGANEITGMTETNEVTGMTETPETNYIVSTESDKIDYNFFVSGELKKNKLCVKGDMTICKGSRLTIESDLVVKGKIIVHYGGFLAVGKDLETNELSAGENSIVQIDGNARVGNIHTFYESYIKIQGNLYTQDTSLRMGNKTQLKVNKSIKSTDKNILHKCDIVMCNNSILKVKDDISCTRLKVGNYCDIKANNIKAGRMEIDTGATINVSGNIFCTFSIKDEGRSSLCVKGSIKTIEIEIGEKSLLCIGESVYSVKVSMANGSELEVRGTLCIETNFNVCNESQVTINDSMNIGGVMSVKDSSIIKANSELRSRLIILGASSLIANSSVYVLEELSMLCNSEVTITQDLIALKAVVVSSKSKLRVDSIIRSPCLSLMHNSTLETMSLCLGDTDISYIPKSSFIPKTKDISKMVRSSGLIVGCNNSLCVRKDATINERIQMDYMSSLVIHGNLTFKGRLALKVIKYRLSNEKILGTITNKPLNPTVRVHGDMTIDSFTNQKYIFIVDGDIEINGKLRYDTANEKLSDAIDLLKKRNCLLVKGDSCH